jgi:hypothetical protein
VSTIDRLNEAADLVSAATPGDPLLAAVGDWLRAEAVTQSAMEPLTDLLCMAIETSGGPKAYLRVGKQEDGELAMQSSTNDHALAVADEIRRRYEADR